MSTQQNSFSLWVNGADISTTVSILFRN